MAISEGHLILSAIIRLTFRGMTPAQVELCLSCVSKVKIGSDPYMSHGVSSNQIMSYCQTGGTVSCLDPSRIRVVFFLGDRW